jgi:NADH pyrophosphatase NudC (nudix superfamily)
MAEYLSPSDYVPTPLPREHEYRFCPHCGTRGEPSNKYLYRCQQYECGRYF